MSDISTDAMMREAAMMDASNNHVWARKVRRLCIERDKLQAQIAAIPAASSHPLASDASRALEADDVYGWINSLPAASSEDVRAGAHQAGMILGLQMAADIASAHDYTIQSSSAADLRAVQICNAILDLIPGAKP